MSFDFAPGRWLEEYPIPPPRNWPPKPYPWRNRWASETFDAGSKAAERIRAAISGRTGPGVDVVSRIMAWAVPGLQDAYDAKNQAGLRGCEAVLRSVADNLPEALTWFLGAADDAVSEHNDAVDARREYSRDFACRDCGGDRLAFRWKIGKDGHRQIKSFCSLCGAYVRFVKITPETAEAADGYERGSSGEKNQHAPVRDEIAEASLF